MAKIRFGKPLGRLFDYKRSFFEENDKKLSEALRLADLYAAQPERRDCKNCSGALSGVSFTKLGVDWVFCVRCGHLNGKHEDTEAFCRAVYTDHGGAAYAEAYTAQTAEVFHRRIADVYQPKAQFLLSALADEGEVVEALSFADLGAGTGYFVGALRGSGIDDCVGFEPSRNQVRLGNRLLGEELLEQIELHQIAELVHACRADVISMIGVLEHLQNPRDLLAVIARSSKVRYLFISVPLFSICVFFEMVFPDIMPRHLVGGHTHLYTDRSIQYFCDEYGFARVAEWWFGLDFADLYRSVVVALMSSPESDAIADLWADSFLPVVDDLQLVLDQWKMSSEVHLLLRVG